MELIHIEKDFGEHLRTKHFSFESDDKKKVWEKAVDIVIERLDADESWVKMLKEMIAKRHITQIYIDNTPASTLEILDEEDQGAARDYCMAALSLHDIVQWWMKNNMDEDELKINHPKSSDSELFALSEEDYDEVSRGHYFRSINA